jgi:hypothetical protein
MWRAGLTIACAIVLLCGCGESTLKVHETEQTISNFVARREKVVDHIVTRPTRGHVQG